jgi:pre-mRNA cleavage complex 2 protein Pcf11
MYCNKYAIFPILKIEISTKFLLQLRKLVEAGVTQEELRQILNQLRTFGQSGAPHLPPPAPVAQPYPAPHPPHPYPPQASYPTLIPSSSFPPATNPPSYPQRPAYPYPSADQPSTGVTDAPPIASSSLISLFESLVKRGVVPATAAASSTGTKEGDEKQQPPQQVDPKRESRRAYRKAILAQKIKLTSADITK